MKYQNNLGGNVVECTICPRNCKLKEGQSGFCHIRRNINGNVELTSYGKTTGLSIDPIEKKPLFHFYPGTKVLSFGTLGCNMGCVFCQNWQISKSKEDSSILLDASPLQIAEMAEKYDCKSVAFTYNEPTIFYEYALDTAIECHKKGIKTVAVTAGFINPEPRKELYNNIDAANVDLKAFTDSFYKRHCLASLEPILETIKYIKHETNCWLELTTLLIEGENDSEEEITKECEWIAANVGTDIPLHFSAFYPAWKFKDRKPTSISTLLKAYDIAKEVGLKYVYTGNIVSTKTTATYCPECLTEVISRLGNEVVKYDLNKGGLCPHCGAKIVGGFI